MRNFLTRAWDTVREATGASPRGQDGDWSLKAGIAALERGDAAAARRIALALEHNGPRDHAAFLRGCCAEHVGDRQLQLAELGIAHALEPGEPAYAIELARAEAACGRLHEAIERLTTLMWDGAHPAAQDPHLLHMLACWRAAAGDRPGMMAPLERALALRPDFIDAAILLAEVMPEQGQDSARAQTVLRRAAHAAGEAGLLLRAALRLPGAYASRHEMADARALLRRDLDELEARPALHLARPERIIGRTAFMLAFHGEDDRPELERLGRVVRRGYVDASVPVLNAAPTGVHARQRIGIVGAHFWLHSVGRAILPLIHGLDRARFEIFAYSVPGQKTDELTARLASAVDWFVTLPDDVAAAARQIAEARLDLLIYPEIGMHPFCYFLAFWRLAPLQCVCAGHPETSGIDSIDFFLTDAAAEPGGAASHYSEALIGIDGFYLPVCDLPHGAHADVTPTAGRYLCSQTIMKLHPDFDILLAGILAADPDGEIVLYRDANERASAVVADRLRRTLGSRAERVRMIPRQGYSDYLATVRSGAVMLDTPHFGGGNTTLEALALQVPVVTMPGAFLRGRFAATRLRSLGLDDCIAEDAGAYATIAVELARSPQRRAEVVDVLRERAPVVLAPQYPARAFSAAIRTLLLHQGRE